MCQVVMEGNAAQEEQVVIHHQHEGGCKDQAPPLCSSSSTSLPLSSSQDHHTSLDPPTLIHSSIPFNLMLPTTSCTSPHLKSSPDDCSIPDFFLPANACIPLDHDPSSLPTSYSSPSSDTPSFWPHSIPPHASAFPDGPSLFSTAASSHHETASFFCDQISTSLPYAVSAADANDSAASYNSSMTRPFHANVYGQHQSGILTINGSHHMIQAPEHPYFSGSTPFGHVYSNSNYSLHHNHGAARPAPGIEFTLASPAPYPHHVDAHANNVLFHQGIVANNEQEQSWHYNFLEQDQEDLVSHPESEALKGPRSARSNAAMAADHHHRHQLAAQSLHTSHACDVPMINLNHHSMGNANARSNPTQQQVQITGLQGRAEMIDTTFNCSTKTTNKRRTPDGEGQDSWPSAAAKACSPPVKMMKSPSLSLATATGPADLHFNQYGASPTLINSYNMHGKFSGGAATSCSSATLSPSTQKPIAASPTKQPHIDSSPKRATKASTRQSVCNDPQSVAARHRRERISERLKTLQQLVPNGSKVDLVTMLEKAISYVKSLQLQVKVLSTDEYWPTPLSEKYSLNNLAVVATIAASTYS